jgi:hypothetical protein
LGKKPGNIMKEEEQGIEIQLSQKKKSIVRPHD